MGGGAKGRPVREMGLAGLERCFNCTQKSPETGNHTNFY